MIRRLSLLFCAGVLAACAAISPATRAPDVSVADIGIGSLGVFEQRFDVGLRIDNRNDFDLVVDALEFELEVNGRPFARGLGRPSQRIPALASTVLRVDAIMPSKNLVEQLRALSPSALKAGVPYRIHGRVRLDRPARWLPFDHAGVYGGGPAPAGGRTI